MPFLERPRANIYHETSGESGPWVTLINGHTRTLRDFKLLTRYLTERGFRVLSLDNRASGESTHDGAFSLDDMANDVVGLWQHIGVERSATLGISMGGLIAQSLAVRFPAMLERLILVSTTCHPRAINEGEPGWPRDPEAIYRKMARYFSSEFLAKNRLLVTAMCKQISKQIESGSFADDAAAQRKAILGFDFSASLGKIQTPTLVLHGENDGIIPVEEGWELARSIPGAKLEVFMGAGHLLLAEAAQKLYADVHAFLAAML